MSKATISPKNERILHTKSGNRCAICQIPLVELNGNKTVCIGENAHIYGEKKTAARYNENLPEEFVNSEKNLIFLCCNCHTKIDRNEDDYSVDKLLEIKAKHEKWVYDSLSKANSEFGFAELEVLANYLIKKRPNNNGDFDYDIISINEKIDKNSLNDVSDEIMMGLTRCKTIEDYCNRHPDTSFSKTLTNIMAMKYSELKVLHNDSIEIFYLLWDFASGYNNDWNYKAAGLSIVTYFFEKCEVFEK